MSASELLTHGTRFFSQEQSAEDLTCCFTQETLNVSLCYHTAPFKDMLAFAVTPECSCWASWISSLVNVPLWLVAWACPSVLKSCMNIIRAISHSGKQKSKAIYLSCYQCCCQGWGWTAGRAKAGIGSEIQRQVPGEVWEWRSAQIIPQALCGFGFCWYPSWGG